MEQDDILVIIESALKDNAIKLDLSNRDITELPPEISKLKNLRYLNLSYNNLTVLPKELGFLSNLETLMLLRNDLTELPKEIEMLTNLKVLDISHNSITKIPENIGKLVDLQVLDLSYCKIQKLPYSFINLLSLKELYLENNAFEFPPQKVIKRGLYATMHFLTEEKRKREAAKVVLQIFNMPFEIQHVFRQYIEYFHEMIDAINDNEILIDISFINQKSDSNINVKEGVDKYMFGFLKFVKDNVDSFKSIPPQEFSEMIELQVLDLRNQIERLNLALNDKINEITVIQKQLTSFTNLFDTNQKSNL